MAAILKFKMAAEDTLEKNGSNSAFVHWSIKKVKSIGLTSIANFALDYITPCTIRKEKRSGRTQNSVGCREGLAQGPWWVAGVQGQSPRKLLVFCYFICIGDSLRARKILISESLGLRFQTL